VEKEEIDLGIKILLIFCLCILVGIYIGINTPQYCNPRINPRPLNTYTWDECHQWFSDNCQMNLTAQYCTSNAQKEKGK